MNLNSLPEFELDFELDDDQEKIISQETTPVEIVDDNTPTEVESENDVDELENDNEEEEVIDYGEKADELAIQTFKQLKDHGIIEGDETDFDGSWEKLDEALSTLPQRVLNTVITEAPEITQQLLKFAFSSENISKDDLKNFAKTYLEELENDVDTLDTMDEAREYLENIYKERGMRPSAIRAALDALEEDDALLEEASAEISKSKENKHQKTDAMIIQKQQEDIQRMEQQQKFVSQIVEELDNTGWTPSRVNRIKTIMSNNNLNDLLQKTISSPKAIVKLADFLDYFDSKTGDIDYSRFMAKANTKQAKSFKDRVEQAINTPNSNTKTTLTNPNKDLDDLVPVLN